MHKRGFFVERDESFSSLGPSAKRRNSKGTDDLSPAKKAVYEDIRTLKQEAAVWDKQFQSDALARVGHQPDIYIRALNRCNIHLGDGAVQRTVAFDRVDSVVRVSLVNATHAVQRPSREDDTWALRLFRKTLENTFERLADTKFVEALPRGALQSLPSAQKALKFSIGLPRISRWFLKAAKNWNLIDLDLSENVLTALPKALFELFNLERLNVSGNKLTEIPASISSLDSLAQLDVSDNRLNHVAPELFECPRLKHLSLARNNIQILPDDPVPHALEHLDVSENNLAILPNWLRQRDVLKHLDVSNNLNLYIPEDIYQKYQGSSGQFYCYDDDDYLSDDDSEEGGQSNNITITP